MSVLPFDGIGEIKTRDGATVADVRCRVWKDRGSYDDVGQRQDLTGVVLGADSRAELVGKQNRVLVTAEGAEYRVTEAIYYPMLDYVGVSLRQVLANG
jgi:hypothetical protein